MSAHGVAFPNDVSQLDKGYIDRSGRRPPFVLCANVKPTAVRTISSQAREPGTPRRRSTSVAGVLIPVDPDDLERLAAGELRYELCDVSSSVTTFERAEVPHIRAAIFVGRAEFTRSGQADRGVVPRAYQPP